VILPGRELREDTEAHFRRVEEFKQERPDFLAVLGASDLRVPQSVHDEILRMKNGPDVTYFLAQYPDVTSELNSMHPLDAADYIEEISQELDRAKMPGDDVDISQWLRLRNQSERKRKTNAKK
jgi:hypothetical protein